MTGLSYTTNVSVIIKFINDKEPFVVLDGIEDTLDYNITYIEEGPAVFLSRDLYISDDDSDASFLINATVKIEDRKF